LPVAELEQQLPQSFGQRTFAMPRFFFHLSSPETRSMDDVGGEFADVENAYLEAHRAALEIAFEMLRDHRDPNRFQFDIVDEQGRFLLDVPFSEVMRPRSRAICHSVILGKLRKNLRRSKELQLEIRNEFAQTQVVLESARATMKKSRARD
jgi:hypothetical protein